MVALAGNRRRSINRCLFAWSATLILTYLVPVHKRRHRDRRRTSLERGGRSPSRWIVSKPTATSVAPNLCFHDLGRPKALQVLMGVAGTVPKVRQANSHWHRAVVSRVAVAVGEAGDVTGVADDQESAAAADRQALREQLRSDPQ